MARTLEWYSKDQPFIAIASAGQGVQRLYSAVDEGRTVVKDATVTRLIVDIKLRADAVGQIVRLWWGIVIVSTEARQASALPDADDMSDRHDWLVRGRLDTIQLSLSDSSQWASRSYDLRTQRVLRSEESELVLVVDAGSDGFTMNWSTFVRTLIRHPA